MYGSGLRILECITLRVKDIDLDRREIVVRGGKGKKDRRTPLAEVCVRPLKRVLEQGRERFHKDERAAVRTTGLSAALAWKYPTAESEWRWAYLFAAARTSRDDGGVLRRHHYHESAIRVSAARTAAWRVLDCVGFAR
jgi:integrase